jgi:hypothetical protein
MKSDIANNHNSRWSKQQVETLKQLVKNGSNSSQIAIALGRTRASVMAKKSALGLEDRIQRGAKGSYSAPMILRNKKRSSVSGQQELPFEKPATKTATVKVKPSPSQSSGNLEQLMTQIRDFGKRSGLKITVTFEN